MTATTFAIALITIRLVYGFLAVFNPSSSMWSGLEGSLVAYILMSFLPEYITTILLAGAGLLVRHDVLAKQSDLPVRLRKRTRAGA